MTDTLTDTLSGLQVRELQVRADADVEAREVTGIGVPFGETIQLWWGREEFDPACEFDGIERARLLYLHGEVIGRLIRWERTEAGVQVTLRISDTARGQEVYTLVRDGAIDRLSIGFRPVEYSVREEEGQDPVVIHTRVEVREFSLVPFPAYEGAVVTDVRSAPVTQSAPANPNGRNPMTQTATPPADMLTRAEFDALMAERDDQHRAAMAALADRHAAAAPAAPYGSQWRSAGHWVQAIAANDAEALEFHRAVAAGVFSETGTPSTWIQDAIKLVDDRRRVLNSFSRESLPAEGMNLEYLKLNTNSIVVAEQAAETDDLTFGEISLNSATAPVKTYGGYTRLSFNAVNRAPITYLNTALRAMDIAYAKATETVVRTFLTTTVAAQLAAGNKVFLTDGATADIFDWLDAIVDAAELADTRGFTITGLKVDKTLFKKFAKFSANGEPLLEVQAGQGVNRVGTFRASALTASVADIQVELVPGAAAGFATFYDQVAITTWEQPGAPVQLQDENVVNLSKEFSKYGAMAVGSQFPTALIPVDTDGVA